MGSLADDMMAVLPGTGSIADRLRLNGVNLSAGSGSVADRMSAFLPGTGSLRDREKAYWAGGGPVVPVAVVIGVLTAGPGAGQVTINWTNPTGTGTGGANQIDTTVYIYESVTNIFQGSWVITPVNGVMPVTYITPGAFLVPGKVVFAYALCSNYKGSSPGSAFSNTVVVP